MKKYLFLLFICLVAAISLGFFLRIEYPGFRSLLSDNDYFCSGLCSARIPLIHSHGQNQYDPEYEPWSDPAVLAYIEKGLGAPFLYTANKTEAVIVAQKLDQEYRREIKLQKAGVPASLAALTAALLDPIIILIGLLSFRICKGKEAVILGLILSSVFYFSIQVSFEYITYWGQLAFVISSSLFWSLIITALPVLKSFQKNNAKVSAA